MRLTYSPDDGTIRGYLDGKAADGSPWIFFGKDDFSGQAIYTTAQWLHAHDDGEPYEIIGDNGSYRITVQKLA